MTVSATAAPLTSPDIAGLSDIDTACVTMQTATGRIAVITKGRRTGFGYDGRMEAHGALRMLRTENVPQSLLVQEREDGARREKPLFFFVERYAQSYRNEWNDFVRVLSGEEAPCRPARTADRRCAWPTLPINR